MRLLSDHLLEINGQTVLVRANYDVPIANGQVQDTTRIADSIETIRAILDHGGRVLLVAHYDRPEGRIDEQKSLKPVVSGLEELIGESVLFIDSFSSPLSDLPARVILLENLRFWPGEEANQSQFAAQLAQLGNFYVNEAFANCHRQHASIVGLPKILPSAAGLRLTKEIEILSKVRNMSDQPLVVVIGGAKLETKEPLVKAFSQKADAILIGGKIAADLKEKNLTYPGAVIAELDNSGQDITAVSAKQFAEQIMAAKTVIWNGTMGVFENPEHQLGTKIVAEAIDKTPAFTVIGGGNTETALTELNLEQNIDHISTGGGAMLEFLANGTLPGIEALGYQKA